MAGSSQETVRLVQRQDYQFTMAFGGDAPEWLADEPPPLGQGAGPSPVQLLAAAVGNCLSDSLLFATSSFGEESSTTTGALGRVVRRRTTTVATAPSSTPTISCHIRLNYGLFLALLRLNERYTVRVVFLRAFTKTSSTFVFW